MDAPKRCPFCKATEGLHITILPTVSFGKEVSVEESWKAVKCHTCGATGPMAKSPKEAEHLWNTRHTHDQIKEVIEAAREISKTISDIDMVMEHFTKGIPNKEDCAIMVLPDDWEKIKKFVSALEGLGVR